MMSLSSNNHVRFYDIRIKKMVKTMLIEGSLSAGDFHTNGHSVGIGTLSGDLLVYDLRKDLNRTVFHGHNSK